MVKRKLEEFEKLDTVGVGTVGTIYRARDLKLGHEVALKVLLPMVSSNELIKARFEREMLILEKLSHRNIVQYFGGGRDGDQLFYAMELVRGGTLKEMLLQSGPLSWQETAACTVQICSALQYAHNYGIIHRDLKPANLFFNTDGEVKLGDFGIARDTTTADITNAGMTVGTHAYMSPEQIGGDKSITGKTDLYALGCLLFEMLTGRPPYQAEHFAQLFDQHLKSPPPHVRDFVKHVPAELDELICQLLAKDPDDRPFNARSVQIVVLRLLDRTMAADEDTSGDVPAAKAVDYSRVLLSRRVKKMTSPSEATSVSWVSLACLFLAVAAVVAAVSYFGQ